MLEVINGFLLVYFLILCTLSALVPNLVKPIAACFSGPSNEERKIWSELIKLKAEQAGISMKDEFSTYSKLQRKINKLESELKDNSKTRLSKSLTISSSIRIILQSVVTFVIVVSIIWFRSEPIVSLKGNLFPFATMLRYPSEVPNTISTHVWVFISNLSIRILLKPLIS